MAGKYQELFSLFNTASSRIKYPSLSLSYKGKRINIYLATKGYIAIKVDGEYTGKITSQDSPNVILYGISMDDPLREAIENFCQSPISEAKILGQRFAHCVFCNRELTNAASLEMGYGPICADTFGLPWGSESSPSSVTESDL